MSVDFNDFLKWADEYAGLATDEVGFRNVASRAYYACYHAALHFSDRLPNHGGVPANVGVHESLICRLSNFPTLASSTVSERYSSKWAHIRGIGAQLTQLKKYRACADYDLLNSFERGGCDTSVLLAKKLIKKIQEVESILASD